MRAIIFENNSLSIKLKISVTFCHQSESDELYGRQRAGKAGT